MHRLGSRLGHEDLTQATLRLCPDDRVTLSHEGYASTSRQGSDERKEQEARCLSSLFGDYVGGFCHAVRDYLTDIY